MRGLFLTARLCLLFTLPIHTGCMQAYQKSLGGDTNRVFERIYVTDSQTAWQASLEALKHTHIALSNQEAGFIQTKWVDNTAERNFTESFAEADLYLKSRYRFQLTLTPGFFNRKPMVKVAVQKEQMTQRDVLEGWRSQETDGIDETTLLYRIGRLIYMRMKLNELENAKAKKALEAPQF
jgi:hypothetical protein